MSNTFNHNNYLPFVVTRDGLVEEDSFSLEDYMSTLDKDIDALIKELLDCPEELIETLTTLLEKSRRVRELLQDVYDTEDYDKLENLDKMWD